MTLAAVAVTLLLVSLTSGAGVAHADSPLAKPTHPEARAHFAAGNRLYGVREFERAIEEYKAGALKEDSPAFLYNLGQCYRMLGRYAEAVWHYERFLDRAKPTGPMRDAVEGFLRQMKDELARKAMTQPPVEPASDPAPAAARRTEPVPHATVEAGVSPAPWHHDRTGWTLAGAGAVCLGVTAYLLVSAASLLDESNREPDLATRDALRDRAGDRRLLAAVTGVAGGALVVAGAIKLAIHPTARDRGPIRSVAVDISLRGVVLLGRF